MLTGKSTNLFLANTNLLHPAVAYPINQSSNALRNALLATNTASAAAALANLNSASNSLAVSLRSTNNIVAWAAAGAYQPNGTITRNGNGVITAMAVKWPDGSPGVFVGTPNANGFGLDAYSITYIYGGVTNTVTQPTVTRDSNGNVITAPTLNFQ